jgi:hypothetical protein
MPRSYWRWETMLESNATGFFPYTPATNLLYGLDEALTMLREEGLPQVFARHHRLAEATRRAVQAWGLELLAVNPSERSDALTAVLMPEGHDADALRAVILERFDTSLGAGLGKVKGRVFRIGHLGHFNEPMLLGTLGAVEAGLVAAGVPFTRGGRRRGDRPSRRHRLSRTGPIRTGRTHPDRTNRIPNPTTGADMATTDNAAHDDRLDAGMQAQAELLARGEADGAVQAGWKAGFGTTAWREKFGLDAPLVGFLLDTTRIDERRGGRDRRLDHPARRGRDRGPAGCGRRR